MAQEVQIQPIHSDKPRVPVNITLFLGLMVAVFGLLGSTVLFPGDMVILGLGSALYTWFRNARAYFIYPDALVIHYGKPRVRVVPFSEISRLEMRSLPMPDRLRVWRMNGRRIILNLRNPEEFHEKLEEALGDFQQQHPEQVIIDAKLPEDAPPSQGPAAPY